MKNSYYVSSGPAWESTTAGQQYAEFHTALLNRCYPKPTNMSTSDTPNIIHTPQGRKLAGYVRAIHSTPVFVKQATESKHLHRKLDAWGIDSRVLDVLEERGVRYIRVESDDCRTYTATIEIFRRFGIARNFGYGAQVFLPRKYWEVRR